MDGGIRVDGSDRPAQPAAVWRLYVDGCAGRPLVFSNMSLAVDKRRTVDPASSKVGKVSTALDYLVFIFILVVA